jgi:hypothetical protein
MANEFGGTAFYGQWITTGGTVQLNTDYRNFQYTPNISFMDAAAGADVAPNRLPYMTDGDVTCTMLMLSNMGTASTTAFAEGRIGTLIWGEAGTAAGSPKVTLPAICQGLQRGAGYSDVISMTVTWLQNGTRVDATY